MTHQVLNPLLRFFAAPAMFIRQACAADWTEFLQLARQHGLTARFYHVLERSQLLDAIPEKVKQHGLSGARYAAKQQHSLFFELQQLEKVFAGAGYPCLLLKGAAYRGLALSVSYGRLFSDIDILVPADKMADARNRLFFSGYSEGSLSDYDRRYYLNWAHQNPPLQHYQRGTVIDLHHHIYPVASARTINIAPVFDSAVQVNGSVFSVPAAAHLFIHAAVHLFYQEETHKLLKDLIDLNELLQEVAQQQQLSFMLEQSREMSVQSAVANACMVLHRLFGNEVAGQQIAQYHRFYQPSVCRLLLMMLSGNRFTAWLAQQLWFIRGHSLKMRWSVLLYHSLAKPGSRLRNWFKTVPKSG